MILFFPDAEKAASTCQVKQFVAFSHLRVSVWTSDRFNMRDWFDLRPLQRIRVRSLHMRVVQNLLDEITAVLGLGLQHEQRGELEQCPFSAKHRKEESMLDQSWQDGSIIRSPCRYRSILTHTS